MRNFLMTTAAAGELICAGLIAAVPALAADMLSPGVDGYMEQWFGYADRSDMDEEGGWAAQANSETVFKGSLESDMGLKYTVYAPNGANYLT